MFSENWFHKNSKLFLRQAVCAVLLMYLQIPVCALAGEVRVLVVPEVEAVLSGQMAGRIVSISAQEGEGFKKGQVLVEFDCAVQRAQLQKARMELEAANETLNANKKIVEYGSGSETDVTLASAMRKRAQAEVGVQEATVEMCLVKAPFSGRVVKLKARAGESVAAGEDIIEVLDDSRLKLHLLAPSAWLAWLKNGLAFTIRIDETGKSYAAKVKGIGARVNPVNQTVEISAVINVQAPELLAGMSGAATFTEPGR